MRRWGDPFRVLLELRDRPARRGLGRSAVRAAHRAGCGDRPMVDSDVCVRPRDGLAMLFVFRMLLGLAESVIFPTNARIFAEHAPEHQRGRCNSAMSIGHSMGPTVGTLVGAMVLIAYGWRAVFFALGGLSLLWLIPWLARRDPSLEADAARGTSAGVLSRDPPPARAMGGVPRSILLFLPLLSRSHLASPLPRQQPASCRSAAWQASLPPSTRFRRLPR